MSQQLFLEGLSPLINSGATFSDCNQYRLLLWRIWDSKLPCLGFIMLNPSTADTTNNDPTIRKCINIAKHNNFGGIYVANLFTLRTPYPEILYEHKNPIGEDADKSIQQLLDKTSKVICAWGRHGTYLNRGNAVFEVLTRHSNEVYTLGVNKDGTPKHPLYQKNTQELIPYIL